MKVIFKEQFNKDILKINKAAVKNQIYNTIMNVEKAAKQQDINNLRKLSGFKTAYRIRIGEYRMGIYIEQSTVIFSRVLPRKDIYKKFP